MGATALPSVSTDDPYATLGATGAMKKIRSFVQPETRSMSSVIKVIAVVSAGWGAALFAATSALRVCADPNNLPYSNEQQQGFENELAHMIASDLKLPLSYTWFAQRGAFFRKTLDSGGCDVVMGVPAGMEHVSTTRPYYGSGYVFVSRRDRNLDIHSVDDPRLHQLRIGVHILGDGDSDLPPVHMLTSRGLVRNLVGYSIFGNLDESNPPSDLIKAVEQRDVDIAVAWGPMAGYFALRSASPLAINPIDPDPSNPSLPIAFDIALGVRPADQALKERLDEELVRRGPQIKQLLEFLWRSITRARGRGAMRNAIQYFSRHNRGCCFDERGLRTAPKSVAQSSEAPVPAAVGPIPGGVSAVAQQSEGESLQKSLQARFLWSESDPEDC